MCVFSFIDPFCCVLFFQVTSIMRRLPSADVSIPGICATGSLDAEDTSSTGNANHNKSSGHAQDQTRNSLRQEWRLDSHVFDAMNIRRSAVTGHGSYAGSISSYAEDMNVNSKIDRQPHSSSALPPLHPARRGTVKNRS